MAVTIQFLEGFEVSFYFFIAFHVFGQQYIEDELLDPRKRFILEKMTVARKEEILSDPTPLRPHYLVQPNDLVMIQFNPVHTLTSYVRRIFSFK